MPNRTWPFASTVIESPTIFRMQLARSFSTKGHMRGLGTYSMKLLSERYLRGTVSFMTSLERGTTFTARYPLSL